MSSQMLRKSSGEFLAGWPLWKPSRQLPASEQFFPSVSGNLEGKGKAERAGELVADGKMELAKTLQEKIYSVCTSLSRDSVCYPLG